MKINKLCIDFTMMSQNEYRGETRKLQRGRCSRKCFGHWDYKLINIIKESAHKTF